MLVEMALITGLGFSGFEIFKTIKSNMKNTDTAVTEEELGKEFKIFEKYPCVYSENNLNAIQLATNFYISNNEYYMDAQFRNYMVIGAPGSGKGRRCIFPNLLNPELRGTVIINDPTGEFYRETSKVQKKFGRKIVYLSFDEIHDSINIISELNDESDFLELAKTILINASVSGNGKISLDTMSWVNLSATLLTSVLLLVKEYSQKNKDVELGITEAINILMLMKNENEYEELVQGYPLAYTYYLTYKADGGKSSVKSSILSNILTLLGVFLTENIQKLTRRTSFDIDKIRDEEFAIYIKSSETKSSKYTAITSMFLNLLLDKCMQKSAHNGNKNALDVHFFLDEFGNAGRVSNFSAYSTLLRKHKTTFFLGLQSYDQLGQYYSSEEISAIMAGISNKVFLSNNREPSTVEYISTLTSSKLTDAVSYSYNKSGELQSTNISAKETNVLSAGDAGTIQDGEGLLIIGGEDILKVNIDKFDDIERYQEFKSGRYKVKQSKKTINKNIQIPKNKLNSVILSSFRDYSDSKIKQLTNIKPVTQSVMEKIDSYVSERFN